MAAVGESMVALDLTPPRDATLTTPPSAAMARLRRLHAAAGHLAENDPPLVPHHAARQFEFSWVRRVPAHGVGPCRPGTRRSVPRLLCSRCRARTLLFRSRLCELSSPEDLGTAQAE
jgi:hypothetical protein